MFTPKISIFGIVFVFSSVSSASVIQLKAQPSKHDNVNVQLVQKADTMLKQESNNLMESEESISIVESDESLKNEKSDKAIDLQPALQPVPRLENGAAKNETKAEVNTKGEHDGFKGFLDDMASMFREAGYTVYTFFSSL